MFIMYIEVLVARHVCARKAQRNREGIREDAPLPFLSTQKIRLMGEKNVKKVIDREKQGRGRKKMIYAKLRTE